MIRRATPLLLCLAAWTALGAERGDFRSVRWGDSMETVRESEGATFHHRGDDEMAFTDDSIPGIDGGIVYLFERGALVAGVYVSRQEYPGGDGVLEDYRAMRRHFVASLGEGWEESERWTDALNERSAEVLEDEALSAAIADGRLRVATEWSTERTHVTLLMTGSEDGGVSLRAVFKPSG